LGDRQVTEGGRRRLVIAGHADSVAAEDDVDAGEHELELRGAQPADTFVE
jgi:hypothetical protein